MAGALAMACGHSAALLLLLTTLGLGQRPHPQPGPPGLQHSYDCGVKGMQLLVFPPLGQAIHFKVADEFGNRFEVGNCSVCYHWVTAEPRGPAVFSADYKGCHVLEKDGHYHLTVSIEAVLPDGHVDVARDVTLVCPKPDSWIPDGHLAPPTPSSPPTLHTPPLRPMPEHSVTRPTLASPTRGSGPPHPTLARPQWGILEHGGVNEPAHTGTNLSQEQCQVASGHIPCVVRRSSKEACEQAGCCYDPSREVPCYYGNTATVQCFRNGHFIVVVSQEIASAHRVTLGSMHLAHAPARCAPTQETGSFIVFHFPVTHCGTTAQVMGSQLTYENQLVSDMDVRMGPQGSVTRDGTFRLNVRCIFNASEFLPLQASIFPPPWPAPVAQSGPLRLELRIAKDETFHSYYREEDYPIVRRLREPVAVEVRLLQRTDPRLALLLQQCWATPSASPFQQPQWPILSDGCPFEGDSYRTQMVALDGAELPFPAHYQRFTVATFALLDADAQRALRGPVYFFCSASACSRSRPETCSTDCGSGTARRRRSSGHHDIARPRDIVSSPGPVGFEDSDGQEPTLGPSGATRNSDPRPLPWGVLSLVAVALVFGVSVVVGLRQAQARGLQRKATEGERAQ